MLGRSRLAVATMIGCLPTQALAFLAVFVYATHATQAIAFGWKPGFRLIAETDARSVGDSHILLVNCRNVGKYSTNLQSLQRRTCSNSKFGN